MTYLVTGASGFIGSYVVRQLLEEGETVVAFDRQFPGALGMVLGDIDPQATVLGDVEDLAWLLHTVQEHDVTRIIHLAAELHDRSAANPGRCILSNVVGTHNALEVSRLTGVERVVTASSAAIFGPSELHDGGKVLNDSRLYANDVYEASKIFGESEGEYYFRRFGVDNAAVRVGLAYGHGCLIGNGFRLINELIYKPLRGERGRVEYGDSSMNFTYALDSAAAFVAMSRATTKETFAYNLRGDHRKIRDAVGIARELIPGADIDIAPGTHHWAQDFDDTPLRQETGFSSKWSLEDGLADIVRRVRG